MTDVNEMTVRILKRSTENILQSKDEEYTYWQNRLPLERLVATQELSFAFFVAPSDEAEIRRQFLRSPVCLPMQKPKA